MKKSPKLLKSSVAATLKIFSSPIVIMAATVRIMPSFMLVLTQEALSRSLKRVWFGWLPVVIFSLARKYEGIGASKSLYAQIATLAVCVFGSCVFVNCCAIFFYSSLFKGKITNVMCFRVLICFRVWKAINLHESYCLVVGLCNVKGSSRCLRFAACCCAVRSLRRLPFEGRAIPHWLSLGLPVARRVCCPCFCFICYSVS